MSIDEHLERVRAGIERIEPREAFARLQRGVRLVDTRPEFQRRRDGEVPGAIVIERNHLEWRLDPASSGAIAEAKDGRAGWIIMCDESYASSLAVRSLLDTGMPNVSDLAGGFQAWRAAGLPVIDVIEPTQPRAPSD